MDKIKGFIESEKGKDVFIVLIVILVGLASFELGRLSRGNPNAGIKVEYPNSIQNQGANTISALVTASNTTQNSTSKGKSFFASNRGSKYYSLGCSGGQTIKQENRIYFASSTEAEAAGYQLSSACK